MKDLTTVGNAASPSAKIAKSNAKLGDLVICQSNNPRTAKTPHVISSFPNFHWAFLLTKEARNISAGLKPAINVGSDSNPTPCLIWAEKATIGARAHINHVILSGLVLPFRVLIR